MSLSENECRMALRYSALPQQNTPLDNTIEDIIDQHWFVWNMHAISVGFENVILHVKLHNIVMTNKFVQGPPSVQGEVLIHQAIFVAFLYV